MSTASYPARHGLQPQARFDLPFDGPCLRHPDAALAVDISPGDARGRPLPWVKSGVHAGAASVVRIITVART
ncbi:MAG: hypothetical protein WB611_31450 [Stellaceae bacterium]